MYKIACDRFHPESCHDLAVMYNKGDTGVEPNPVLFEKYKQKLIGFTKEQRKYQKMVKKIKDENE